MQLSTSISLTGNSAPVPILTYHQIDEAPARGASFRGLYVTAAAFARQMAMLKLQGYQGLSMTALIPYLLGDKIGKVVGITFDDGYLNNLKHALPVLAKHGFSSTCYMVSQRLGQSNVWDLDSGVSPAKLMDVSALRQWIAAGQEVGAHTRHHVRLLKNSDDTNLGEIAGCKAELQDLSGVLVNHFCYPYGEFTLVHRDMVRQAGYASATTTQRSRCLPGDDLYQLPRVPILRTTTLPSFWLKLATTYEDRRRA